MTRVKIEKYDGSKTYMFPTGHLATSERVKKDYPAVEAFTHIVETDDEGQGHGHYHQDDGTHAEVVQQPAPCDVRLCLFADGLILSVREGFLCGGLPV